MKINMDARKLEDVDVSFVSLVKRGANRIPFRIIKSQEEGMSLDLGTLFKTKKADAPTVVAFVVEKTRLTDDVIQKLEAKGFVQQEPDSDATSIVFKAAEYTADAAIVKMDEDCAVVLSTKQKSFYSWPEGTDFDANLAKGAFFPSVYIAQEILEETLANIMHDSDIGVDAKASELGRAIDSFKAYVVSLANNLPASAFELAKYIRVEPEEVSKEDTTMSTNTEKEHVAATESAASKEGVVEETPTSVAKDEMSSHQGTVEGLEEISTDVAKADETASAATTIEKEESSDEGTATVDPVLETVTKMAEALTVLSGKVDTLMESNKSLGEQVEKAEATAVSALEAVNGTVVSGASEEDEVTNTVAKSDATDLYAGTALDLLT